MSYIPMIGTGKSARKVRLYLAGPLFTVAEREFNKTLRDACIDEGFEVWLPQDHEPREQTARAIFEEDVKGINWADIVVANMDGPDPDSGTCWECGYAYHAGKAIYCYRTDMRNASDFEGSDYNLMLSASADVTVRFSYTNNVRDIARMVYHNAYHGRGLVK